MQKFLYFLAFSLLALTSSAQQRYFLYIQSEDRQPFYVRLSEKVYSSSESGYLIIPKLDEGNYPVLLGFPRNLYPEQQFQVRINKKDRGFQLKRSTDRSWELVNLQNQEVVTNSAVNARNFDLTGEKKTDAFSVMLANVVNDSAILYAQQKPEPPKTVVQKQQPPAKKEEVKPAVNNNEADAEAIVRKEAASSKAETNRVITATDTSTSRSDTGYVTVKIKETESSLPALKTTAAEKKAPDDKPFISKISEEKSTTMYRATYLEQYNYTTDTIDITIPVEGAVAVNTRQNQTRKDQEPGNKEKTTTGIDEVNTPPVTTSATLPDTTTAKKKIIIMNSDCKNFATENDVDKLRVRLLAAKNIDDKLAAARRYYRTRCFTVQQIKALTELFPSDETKYRFLDLSYAFTSDSGNYFQLEEVISEEYYKNRFKAMIRK
jgi:hypothetical protein